MPPIGSRCAPSALEHQPIADSLRRLVEHYQRSYLPDALAELNDFSNAGSLANALDRACMAVNSNGEKFPHQWRIKLVALPRATQAIVAATRRINQCQSFNQLHEVINSTAGQIEGIGELYVYDTSLRIGAYLGLRPEVVYLHAGTKTGAKYLVRNLRRPSIPPNELPRELRRLPPWQIEDILCIYKDRLRQAAGA